MALMEDQFRKILTNALNRKAERITFNLDFANDPGKNGKTVVIYVYIVL